ncbi:thioredoxin domain-containing protein [Gallaecimonas kandeliae]|uniref:thioredoxin domain-containing protein n=1 Tax=Gallaecimonas kandeliae TaxID=3029055 RepID=UPI002647A767|nr:thioredoxin domain-containing protein [Gallaecimonas kandeliae]WKE66203.1 thioredoxin domain-containing protein [Gallaecimonas kandeliae]
MKLKLLLAGFLLALCGQAFSASQGFSEGKDYKTLAEPIVVKGKQPFLIEYFWLGCPHCQALNPLMMDFEKAHPGTRVIHRPAIGGPRWVWDAHVFYALMETGHGSLFNDFLDFYKAKRLADKKLPDLDDIKDYLDKHGVDSQAFVKAMDSDATMAKLERDLKDEETIGVHLVPTIVVAGKYLVLAPHEGKEDQAKRYFALIDYLLAKASS